LAISFDEKWSDLQRVLLPGTLVRNWVAEEGYSGGTFHINDVDDTGVTLRFGQTKRMVPKADFRRLFALWDAYGRGTVRRADLAKASESATFILSILHWHDEMHMQPATLFIQPARLLSQSEVGSAARLDGHDEYGKKILYEATEGRAIFNGPSVEIDYGSGQIAQITATVGDIAIAIERATSKQVRGTLLDLIWHSYSKKLLLLLHDHMTSSGPTALQCRNILKRFCADGSFRVLVLKGSGSGLQVAEDTAMTAAALAELRSDYLC
jgi:hypothetical protein